VQPSLLCLADVEVAAFEIAAFEIAAFEIKRQELKTAMAAPRHSLPVSCEQAGRPPEANRG